MVSAAGSVLAFLAATATAVSSESCSHVASHYSVVATHNAPGPWEASLSVERHAPSPAMRFGVRPVTTHNADSVTVTLRGQIPLEHLVSQIEGYEELPGQGWYRVAAERRTWAEARATCEAEGAHLVLVDTPEEAAALSILLGRHLLSITSDLHAGFFAKDYASSFATVTGQPLSGTDYDGWAPGQPDMNICGRVDLDGLWRDGMCDWVEPVSFVCERLSSSSPVQDSHVSFVNSPAIAAPALPGEITPTGYETVSPHGRGSTYKLHTELKTWAEAKAQCEEEGSHLMVIDSDSEAEVVRRLVELESAHLPPYLFVGARAEINFVTVFGEPLMQERVDLWATNYPAFQNCVSANHNGTLWVTQCWSKYPFVCEYEST